MSISTASIRPGPRGRHRPSRASHRYRTSGDPTTHRRPPGRPPGRPPVDPPSRPGNENCFSTGTVARQEHSPRAIGRPGHPGERVGRHRSLRTRQHCRHAASTVSAPRGANGSTKSHSSAGSPRTGDGRRNHPTGESAVPEKWLAIHFPPIHSASRAVSHSVVGHRPTACPWLRIHPSGWDIGRHSPDCVVPAGAAGPDPGVASRGTSRVGHRRMPIETAAATTQRPAAPNQAIV